MCSWRRILMAGSIERSATSHADANTLAGLRHVRPRPAGSKVTSPVGAPPCHMSTSVIARWRQPFHQNSGNGRWKRSEGAASHSVRTYLTKLASWARSNAPWAVGLLCSI